MSDKFSAKEISDITMTHVRPILELNGFRHYKGKSFVKVSGDILFLIGLYPYKKDYYIWYAVYPLCEYKIWLGSASIAGRFPSKNEPIKVETKADLQKSLEIVKSYFPRIFEFFSHRSNIEKLESAITDNDKVFPLLVKGICLAYLDKPEEAKLYLQKFLDSGFFGGDCREGAEKLMAAISDGSYREFLEINKNDNIKKLRLKKFLSIQGEQ